MVVEAPVELALQHQVDGLRQRWTMAGILLEEAVQSWPSCRRRG
jgi:hypothetical protein